MLADIYMIVDSVLSEVFVLTNQIFSFYGLGMVLLAFFSIVVVVRFLFVPVFRGSVGSDSAVVRGSRWFLSSNRDSVVTSSSTEVRKL